MDIEKGKYIGHILPSRVSLTVWLIDDFTREEPSGQVKVLIGYLFNWDEIPGIDEVKLIELLEHDFGITWAQPNDISRPDDRTIVVSNENGTISLTLDNEKTKATRVYLKIDDGRTDEFIVRMDNDSPRIYREHYILPVRNLSGYYVFKDLPSGSFELGVESDHYFFEKKIIDTTRINIPDVSLEFHANGPAEGALFVILKDTSKLKTGDIVELRNPKGSLEQRMINDIDNNTKTISWDERLTKDFSAKYSTISVLRYVPVTIIIKPKPSYPFPDNATLVRGSAVKVYASNTVPVKDALVKVLGDALVTITDKNGEFVLYFRDKTERTITINIAKGTVIPVPDVNLMIGGAISLGRISFP